jgi:hypothetical protein
MLGTVDAKGFECFSGSWPAKGAEVLDHGAPHLMDWCISGDEGGEGGGEFGLRLEVRMEKKAIPRWLSWR